MIIGYAGAVAALLLALAGAAAAQPAPDSARPIGILLAAGDISTCGKLEWHGYANRTAEIIRQAITDAKAATPPIPVHVLALGDLAYQRGTPEEFACFQERWSGFDDALLPVPGNHEYLSRDAAPYFNHFKDHPFVNQNGQRKGYFALDFPRPDGPWRLIGLNAHIRGAPARKAQLEWLERQVDTRDAGNRQPCVLAFWHAPTFSSGRHGREEYSPNPKAPLTEGRPMQAAFRILHRAGASVVVAGHEHGYEQFSPQDADGHAAPDGLRLLIAGTGGALLTEDVYDTMAANSEGLFGKTRGVQGVLRIDLFETRYTWDFLPIDPAKKFPLKTTADDCRTRKAPS